MPAISSSSSSGRSPLNALESMPCVIGPQPRFSSPGQVWRNNRAIEATWFWRMLLVISSTIEDSVLDGPAVLAVVGFWAAASASVTGGMISRASRWFSKCVKGIPVRPVQEWSHKSFCALKVKVWPSHRLVIRVLQTWRIDRQNSLYVSVC